MLTISETLKAVQQSALGVMTLEPLVNWEGARAQRQEVDALRYRFQTFQAVIQTTATVQLQGSMDGDNWVSLGELTASGSITNEAFWKYIRVEVTAWTAGTVDATLALSC